jgi:hypothetical protein
MFDVRAKDGPLDPELMRIASAVAAAAAVLISIGAGAVAVAARSEVRSLQLDVAAAHDELALAKERSATLQGQLEAALQTLEQQAALAGRQMQGDQVAEKRGDRPGFRLTQDETQLVRSYIKASPAGPDMAATISVGGDLRNVALLPLPGPIVAKAPRLGGGRFTIDRNGAIVISLRNSQVADAVIQPSERMAAQGQ